MYNQQITERHNNEVLNAMNDWISDKDHDLYVYDFLEKYIDKSDELFINTSGELLYRFFYRC